MESSSRSGQKSQRSSKFRYPDDRNAQVVDALVELQEIEFNLDELNKEKAAELEEMKECEKEVRRDIYDKRAEAIGSIPNFWLTVINNHPGVSHHINERDLECLAFLKEISVDDLGSGKENCYRVKFLFDENPFFQNTIVVKAQTPGSKRLIFVTPIRWKWGMNLTKRKPQLKVSSMQMDVETNHELEMAQSQPNFFGWLVDKRPESVESFFKEFIVIFVRARELYSGSDIYKQELANIQVKTAQLQMKDDSHMDEFVDAFLTD